MSCPTKGCATASCRATHLHKAQVKGPEKQDRCKRQKLKDQNKRYAYAEFTLLGLMPEYMHSKKGSQTASEYRKRDEGTLRHPPSAALRPAFVDTEAGEADQIDDGKIDQ